MPVVPPPSRAYYTTRERVNRHRRTNPPRSTRKRRSGCGLFLTGLIVALILTGLVTVFVVHRFSNVAETIEQEDPRHQAASNAQNTTPGPAVLPDMLSSPFTMLLIGVDKRDDPEEGVRSDTLIVVHINPHEQWASMLSIPRDSVAQLPELGQRKINFAYTYGFANATKLYGNGTKPIAAGGAFAAETVERFLGIRIDYIAQVDFKGFERIVDMVGGITVDVPKPILDAEYPTENFGFERIYIPAGLQVFDGETALRYARSRHSGTDFERSRRQQQVLRALLKQVQERGLLEQIDMLPQLVENVQQSINTTLPISDLSVLRGLAQLAQNIPPDNIIQLSINPNDVRVVMEDGSDIYWNQEDISLLVERFEAGPSAKIETARIQVQNGTRIAGLASRVTDMLRREGYQMSEADDAPALYERTVIIDYTGLPQTRKRLAEFFSVDTHYVYDTPPPNAPHIPIHTDIVVVLGADYEE